MRNRWRWSFSVIGVLCLAAFVSRAEQLPIRAWTTADGLPHNHINRILRDSRGYLWIGAVEGLARFDGYRFVNYGTAQGLPSLTVNDFIEARDGTFWVATDGGVCLFNPLGKAAPPNTNQPTSMFTVYRVSEREESNHINGLLEDPDGSLWLATSGGLFRLRRAGRQAQIEAVEIGYPHGMRDDRLDEVSADRMRLATWDVTKGLATNEVWSVTEDQWGRIYAGTGRGVDRLDPETGYIRHFTSDDGLAKGEVRVSLRDRHNHLWFVAEQGVSRLVPTLDQKPSSLPVLITAVRVNGNPTPVSELGETRIDGLTLAPDQNSVQIDFLSLDFSAGAKLRYQYRLGEQDWSEPSDLRTVNFASFSPGIYRFAVRAISSSGVISDPPAVVTFTIQRPLWQQWWFIAGLAVGLGAVIYGLYRYRLGQALKVERVRTSIARDLHDDIGANLTRISILSEVAKQHSERGVNGAPPPDELLDSIAEISRESVASMNDIVWAVSPEHDSLLDLTRRMRRHAEEVFTTRDIKLDFQAPDGAGELKLDVEMRRDLYLVFKEAVNNAARHAACSAVSIKVWADGAQILLTVSDDGKGFDPAELSEGHGLLSMRNRAQAVGGELMIESSPGAGSEVRLTIPL